MGRDETPGATPPPRATSPSPRATPPPRATHSNHAIAVLFAIVAAVASSVGVGHSSDVCKARGDDAIFGWLERGVVRWGDVLDAGAGTGSLCWLLKQPYKTLTGVTAEDDEGTFSANGLRQASAAAKNVSIAPGNWKDPTFLQGRQYDIVLADYLLGAVDRHWPFGADACLDRLMDAVRPGGLLLIIGLEPYKFVLDRANPQDALVLDIESVRDAAAAAAEEPNYRELPEEWVANRVARHPDFVLSSTKRFPMFLRAPSPKGHSALGFARYAASKIRDDGLRLAFESRISALDAEVLAWTDNGGTHKNARNYVMVVRRRA